MAPGVDLFKKQLYFNLSNCLEIQALFWPFNLTQYKNLSYWAKWGKIIFNLTNSRSTIYWKSDSFPLFRSQNRVIFVKNSAWRVTSNNIWIAHYPSLTWGIRWNILFKRKNVQLSKLNWFSFHVNEDLMMNMCNFLDFVLMTSYKKLSSLNGEGNCNGCRLFLLLDSLLNTIYKPALYTISIKTVQKRVRERDKEVFIKITENIILLKLSGF